MARKKSLRGEISGVLEKRHKGTGKTCGECSLSYDWHNKAVDGHMTLGRCRYKTWCVLTHDAACSEFTPYARAYDRTDNT